MRMRLINLRIGASAPIGKENIFYVDRTVCIGDDPAIRVVSFYFKRFSSSVGRFKTIDVFGKFVNGMEHRNSTILTDTETLANGGQKANIGTVSHEYFHSWNVERIRPADLEAFQFDKANMSNSLWFAEGFTSYYTNLILERAGIISAEDYVKSLNGTFNYVWNSPALQYFNPFSRRLKSKARPKTLP